MNQISKRLQQAVTEASALSPDQQNLIALEITERARSLSEPTSNMTDVERAELEAQLLAARRGELTSDAGVAAMYAKHGL